MRLTNLASLVLAADRVRAIGPTLTPSPAPQRAHSGLVPGVGTRATRVMVTRTDVGTRNARLSVSRGEGPKGRKNPRCDAQYVALPEPLTWPAWDA